MTVLGRVVPAEAGLWVVPNRREDGVELLAAVTAHGVRASRREGRVLVPRADAPRFLGASRADPRLWWSLDAITYSENVAAAVAGSLAVQRALAALDGDDVAAAHAMLEDVVLLPGLDDHQIVNVAAMTVPGGHGLALFDEQGVGKTLSLIAAFDALVQRDEVDVLFVFAPKSMIAEWKHDFDRFTSELYRVQVVSGAARQRRRQLDAKADVFVCNFESAASSAGELDRLVSRYGRRAALAVDESFYVKNSDARRTRAVTALRQRCGRAFVLCGTPAPNSSHDVVAQVSLVDFGLTFDGVDIPRERRQAQPVVRAALAARPGHLRHLKADVLDLPGRTFDTVVLTMSPVQQQLYDEAHDSLIHDVRSTSDGEFARHRHAFAARRMTLLRLASHPAGLVDGYTEIPAKLRALDELLAGIPDDEKVVIWSFYRASVVRIAERYGHLGLVRYDGSVTDVHERRNMVARFQEDDETRIFVGNPAAAGAGLTLHRAAIAVYESLSNQPAHYLQSLDRIHRRGQSRPVQYVVLVCDGTIEVSGYESLVEKHQAARELLLDDDAPPANETDAPR